MNLLFPCTPRRASRKSGVALVITLALLVLLSAIVVAFLTTVTTDVAASKEYQSSANARLLADSAVNLVIGQIRDASTQSNQAWISQPGLLRTYDTTGSFLKAYKLYSSDQLVVASAFDPKNNTNDVPTNGDWRHQSALWVDLNSPVADATRKDTKGNPLLTYPILDGNHLFSTTDQDPALSNHTVGQLALTGTTPDITSFEILNFDPTHPVEMPVKWLYILRDGSIVSASAGSSTTAAKLAIPPGKEKTPEGEVNEPVARVAFWADDDTAKVNVNTASEGTFWDTPICNSQRSGVAGKTPPPSDLIAMFEMDLAEFESDQHEFQRYPGHPATTCLSPIFGRQLSLIQNLRPKMIELIYQMAPRISGINYNGATPTAPYASGVDYSSQGGTRRGGKTGQTADDNSVSPITFDSDRLYASIDELLFNPIFTANQRNSQQLAPTNTTIDNSREMLEMARFFITAQSRAPEQNLFNKPRVAIWPVNANNANRTTFDRTIAFCSTVGPRTNPSAQLPFIFTRQNPANGTDDYQNSPRNQAIYKYLHNLMATRIPGYPVSAGATTFASKYSQDADQILTEIYDYIRCTNLIDRTEGDLKSYTPVAQDVNTQLTKRGQVIPIKIGNTRGLGRVATVSELAVAFVRYPDSTSVNTVKLQVGLVPELFCPMAGFSALANDIRLKFKTIDLTVLDSANNRYTPFLNASNQQIPEPDIYDIGRITDIEDNESKLGGCIGARSLVEGTDPARFPLNIGSPSNSVPPTGELNIPKTAITSLKFYGTVQVDIYAPNAAVPANLIQSLTFHFGTQSSPITAPFPQVSDGPAFSTGPGSSSKGARLSGQYNDMFKSPQDTVRTACAFAGDVRLVAGLATVDTIAGGATPYFDVPAAAKTSTTTSTLHSMRPCWSNVYPGFQCGNLVANLNGYSNAGGRDIRPAIPAGVNGVVNSKGQPGDWDNGQSFILDGPLCNKADEGARRHEHGRSQASGQYDEDSPPYIGWYWNPQDSVTEQTTFFSPNRQIASPITFGSLPTGVLAGLPWQTLLFRPAKSYFPGGANHPGNTQPGALPDHLLLDLFWMPVVEPYPISEPFATAGKINLNQQIVPFTNIKRNTGLRAVLQSVKMAALNPNQPDSNGTFINDYKLCGSYPLDGNYGGGQGVVVRRNIDIDNTLRQIDDRLNKNKPFISASEICDIPLIPANFTGALSPPPAHVSVNINNSTPLSTYDSLLTNFWNQHKLTGDNTLERPYSYIYPRVTTRSNTYTVHVHVQTLKQTKRATQTDEFNDARDIITGDFRGSFVVERYLDPNSAGFYKTDGNNQQQPTTEDDPNGILGPYRFRVISSKQFAP